MPFEEIHFHDSPTQLSLCQPSEWLAIYPTVRAVSCLCFTKSLLSAWISLLHLVHLNISLYSFKIYPDILETSFLEIHNTFTVSASPCGDDLYRSPLSILMVLWTELCPRFNSYVKALIPSVTVFGDRAFKEVMQVKWGHEGGVLIQQDWNPYKERKKQQENECMCSGKAMGGYSMKVAIQNLRRRVWPDTHHDGILILDFWPLIMRK